MPCATVKDVPADKLINAYAALLKRQGKLKPPAWVDYAKTGTFKELGPYNPDWFYIRCASIARHIYLRSGVGVGALRKVYGACKPNGTCPRHFKRGSGSVARKCVQALESIKVLAVSKNGGRAITSTGQRDLDRLAGEICRVLPAEADEDILPHPIHTTDYEDEKDEVASKIIAAAKQIPRYGQRHGWRPRKVDDFADGGAFPEIHMAQYPLGMGLKQSQGKNSNAIVPLQVGKDGKVKYDVLVRQGHHKDRVVHSSYKDLLPADVTVDDEKREMPSEEEMAKTAQETMDALTRVVDNKIAATRATHVQKTSQEPTFIRYTPSQGGSGHNSGARQRIIRMVEEQVDPLEPPKFKTNKVIPRGPPSPPAPVLHSPPRKVTAEEQRNWAIPPCISNWKNHRGFTVPLDKRMAADGRGLQDVTINDNFAKVAEALYVAERNSRIAIQKRHEIRTRAAQKEKERQEDSLRRMAERAREQRAGIRVSTQDGSDNEEGDASLSERNQIRREREREYRRQRNIANAAPDKRSRLQRDDERDVTERIALGLGGPTSKGVSYDTRLYGQSSGISSGFADDDQYNVYDKPMRGTQAQSIYRPTRRKEVDADKEYEDIRTTDRFRADKGFSGADSGGSRVSGPVQFEKHKAADDIDIGLDSFLSEAKEGSSKRRSTKDESRTKRVK